MANLLSPLELLLEYPTMMKWRGTWVDTEQYLKNDVVISPINSASYILANVTTSLHNVDPSLDPNWEELAPSVVGVTSVNPGAGIDVRDPTGPNVTVINTGVITVIQGANISVNNTNPQAPVISATTPSLTTISSGANTVSLNFPAAPSDAGVLLLISIPTSLFSVYLTFGAPEPTGIFNLDLTGINLFLNASTAVAAGDKVEVLMLDSTTSSTPIVVNIGAIEINPTNNIYPFQVRPSTYSFNVTTVRATGFRILNQFVFLNNTSGAVLEMNSWGDFTATYYPNGVE